MKIVSPIGGIIIVIIFLASLCSAYVYGLHVGYRDALIAQVDSDALALDFEIQLLDAINSGNTDKVEELVIGKAKFGLASLRNARSNLSRHSLMNTVRHALEPSYLDTRGGHINLTDIEDRLRHLGVQIE